MEDLKRAIKDLEESVRHCYEETIPLSSDEISSTNTGVLTTR